MCQEDIVLVPLYARDGGIRAYALIDAEDAPRVNRHTWHLTADDRAGRIVSGETIYLHREVMKVGYGDPAIIDHINRQPLDARKSNLRKVTTAQNAQNRSKKAFAHSKHRGVTWNPSPRGYKNWSARFSIGGISHWVGRFYTEEEAAAAVQAARLAHLPYAVD